MSGCFPGCFYYTDSCFRKDCTMNHSTPAHKQTDPDKKPGQIVNPINTDMMDDMGKYASPAVPKEATNVTWTCDPPLPGKYTGPW